MTPRKAIIPVFIPHLGCPNQCVFCNQHEIASQIKEPPLGQIEEAILNAREISNGQPKELAFYGGSFTAIDRKKQEDYLKLAWDYKLLGDISGIRLSTRPDCIDERILSFLKDYGVTTIELGAQSMDDKILERAKRGHTAEEVEKASALIKRFGFELILQIMAGLPGDSRESALKTAHKTAALLPDGVRIYPVVVIRDTQLYRDMNEGRYQPLTVSEAVIWCADMAEVFISANIPIIRIGLNPTEDLSAGAALAGAYHPALGEMVYSELFYRRAFQKIKESGLQSVAIQVSKYDVSKMVGHHKMNLVRLKEAFPEKTFRVKVAQLQRNELQIEADI